MRNRRFLWLVAAGLGLLCLASGARAATKTKLTGQLIDPETGLPAAGVKLLLVEPGEHVATTDATGRFSFENIPAATYRYLFAYARGEQEPPKTILLARRVAASAVGPPVLHLKFRTLLDRPEEIKPFIAPAQYLDGRKRQFTRPLAMTEPLGLHWPKTYVSVPWRFRPGRCRRPSLRIVDGPSGQEIPYQLSDVKYSSQDFIRSCTLTFQASLKPFEKKVYVIASDWAPTFQPPRYPSSLKLEIHKPTGQQILSNTHIALRLPPAAGSRTPLPAKDCPAPILALRGPDGVWFGKGTLVSDRTVDSYTVEETEKGPLFKEIKITYKFAEKKVPAGPAAKKNPAAAEETPAKQKTKPAGEYEVTLLLYNDRDYVLIRERMIGDIDVAFRLSVHENLAPDSAILARDGVPAFDKLERAYRQETTMLAAFRAWNPHGLRRSHDWYGVMSSGNRKDAVGLVQVNGSRWQFADRNAWADGAWLARSRDEDQVRLVATKKPDLYFEFPHRPGTRETALVVFDKARNWDATTFADPKPHPRKRHYLNDLYVELSQLDLPRMLAFQAEQARPAPWPRLLFNARSYATLKKTFQEHPSQIPELLHDVFSGSRAHTSLIRNQIWTGVLALRRAFAGSLRDSLPLAPNPRRLSGFSSRLCSPEIIEPIVQYTVLLYDANLLSGLFSEREKEVILGTLAMVAAQLENPGYTYLFAHDPEAAARRDCALVMLSLLLAGHPKSDDRILLARRSLFDHLRAVQRTGGLPVDMGATMAALNVWADTAPALENATSRVNVGGSPFAWPRYLGTLRRLVDLTTPPDRRFGGARLLPTLGRSRSGDREALAVMGLAAARFAQADPALAGRFAWAWEQAGRPRFGAMTRHQALLNVLRRTPSDVPPEAPAQPTSALLPGFGALLRSKFGTPEEAYLLFKCSPYAGGVHHDQGAILFYAFGAPLLLDPASPPGREATWAHNTVRIDSRTHRAAGIVLAADSFFSTDDDYVIGWIKVDALSKRREYTPAELAAAAQDRQGAPPPGHRADGSQTAEMLPTPETLDKPVLIQRHVLFNKQRQYIVLLDRIRGDRPTELFFDVLADQARVEGTTARFAGPFGVDCDIHAFGTGAITLRLQRDLPRRWILRLSQSLPETPKKPAAPKSEKKSPPKTGATPADKPPANPSEKPETTNDTEPEPPTIDYLTVICPARRALPGEKDVRQYAAPKVDKLPGITGVRITYGNTVRYVFLSEKEIEYDADGVYFKGRRGMLTIRKTHCDVALFDAGTLRYRGTGVRSDHPMVRFRIAPGGFVSGQVSGPKDKILLFYGLGRDPRDLSFRIDGREYIAEETEEGIRFGVRYGRHALTIHPD